MPGLPQTKRVLPTGISAGGFGAGINAAQVADAFGDDVQLVVVDDSGPPLSDDVIAPCLQQIFRDTWDLDNTVLALCPACDPNDFATGLFAHLASAYPTMRLALYSHTADMVIRTVMGFGWGNGQHDQCDGIPTAVPASVYEDDLLAIRSLYQNRPSSFLIGQHRWQYNFGRGHTVLRFGFHTTEFDGTSVPEWLAAVVDGDIVQVGP